MNLQTPDDDLAGAFSLFELVSVFSDSSIQVRDLRVHGMTWDCGIEPLDWLENSSEIYMNILSTLSSRLSGNAANPADRLAELRAKLAETEIRLTDAESDLIASRFAADEATADFATDASAAAALDAAVAKAATDERKAGALRQAVAALEDNIAEAVVFAAEYESKMRKQAEIDRLKAARKTLLADVSKAAKLADELASTLVGLGDLPEAQALAREYAADVIAGRQTRFTASDLASHASAEIDAILAGTTLAARRSDEQVRQVAAERAAERERDRRAAAREREESSRPRVLQVAPQRAGAWGEAEPRRTFADLGCEVRSL